MTETQKQKLKLTQELETLNNAWFMPFDKWELKRMILRKQLLKLM